MTDTLLHSDTLEIDLDRAESIVPEGLAPFRIESVNLEPMGPSGYGYLKIHLKCLTGPGAGEGVFDNLSLSPGARFRINGLLDALQLPVTGKTNARSWVGKTVWGIVKHEVYQGNNQAKIAAYVSGPGDEGSGAATSNGSDIAKGRAPVKARAKLGKEFD